MECFKGTLIDSFTYDNGNMQNYVDRLYRDFYAAFVENSVYFNNKKILVDKELCSDGKLSRFWHLISEGEVEELREPVYERAKRLHWIFGIISDNHCINECEDFFYYEEKNKKHDNAYILCARLNYLIVLRKGKYVYFLKTAYLLSDIKLKKQLEKAMIYKKKETP